MKIERFQWLATVAFVSLVTVSAICLAQKDSSESGSAPASADVKKPETPLSPVPPDDTAGVAAVISLLNLDGTQVSNTLRKLFGNEGTGAPSIEGNAQDRRILFHGTQSQLTQVRALLRDLGEKAADDGSNDKSKIGAGGPAPSSAVKGGAVPEDTLNPNRSKPRQSNRIDGGDVLLVETKDGLAAYSKSLGKWDRVVVGLPKDGRSRLQTSTVSQSFISVLIDDQLFGFSARSGRWGKLKIPEQFAGEIHPTHGLNLLSVEIGDETYVLSPTRGEWTSSSENEPQASEGNGNFDHRLAEQKLGASLDRPELRRLMSDISKQDARAEALASQIREHSKTRQEGEIESPEAIKLRKELESTLHQAFKLKSDLEQLRIQELQSRLAQLEQQMGSRQALRSQIVSRRARELIEGGETKWNDAPQSETNRSNSDTSLGRAPVSGAPSRKAATYSGNEVRVKFASSGLDPQHTPVVLSGAVRLILPAELDVCWDGNGIHRTPLRLVRDLPHIYSRDLVLETYPGHRTDASPEYVYPLFTFTDEDIGPEGSQQAITKVTYQRTTFQFPNLANVETLVSTRLDPGVDPIVEANKRGTIIAVLRMAPVRSDDLRQVQADKSKRDDLAQAAARVPTGADPTSKRAKKAEELSEAAQRFLGSSGDSMQGTFPSYKELATSLLNSVDDLETAKSELANVQKLWDQKVISSVEVEIAKRKLNSAERKRRIVEDDYRGTMHDLELQINAAIEELNAANKLYERLSQLGKSGSVTMRQIDDAKLRVDQARLPVDRLKARYQLYMKAGDILKDQQKSETPAKAPEPQKSNQVAF